MNMHTTLNRSFELPTATRHGGYFFCKPGEKMMAGQLNTEKIEFNKNLGAIVCAARIRMRLSQKQIANKIGVTHQQFQKYETGKNGISIYRLWQISNVLKISFDKFFPTSESKYDDILDKKSVSLLHDAIAIEMLEKIQKMNPQTKYALRTVISSM